jgi:hypothetical protein
MKGSMAILASLALSVVAACQGNVFSLKVGDCFNGGSGETVLDVQVVACTEAHDFEVFATPTYTAGGDDFPGNDVMTGFADRECVTAFQPYVGRDYAASELSVRYLTPTSESWGTGDRVVDCVLYLEGQKLTSSMRGSGR